MRRHSAKTNSPGGFRHPGERDNFACVAECAHDISPATPIRSAWSTTQACDSSVRIIRGPAASHYQPSRRHSSRSGQPEALLANNATARRQATKNPSQMWGISLDPPKQAPQKYHQVGAFARLPKNLPSKTCVSHFFARARWPFGSLPFGHPCLSPSAVTLGEVRRSPSDEISEHDPSKISWVRTILRAFFVASSNDAAVAPEKIRFIALWRMQRNIGWPARLTTKASLGDQHQRPAKSVSRGMGGAHIRRTPSPTSFELSDRADGNQWHNGGNTHSMPFMPEAGGACLGFSRANSESSVRCRHRAHRRVCRVRPLHGFGSIARSCRWLLMARYVRRFRRIQPSPPMRGGASRRSASVSASAKRRYRRG